MVKIEIETNAKPATEYTVCTHTGNGRVKAEDQQVLDQKAPLTLARKEEQCFKDDPAKEECD